MKKVLIVDDSIIYQEYMQSIISADPNFKVVGIAKDGIEAVDKTQLTHPDVITMDIHMPRMNGYEATREIMEKCPTPIIIISSHLNSNEVEDTFRAFQLGAVAVLDKPPWPGSPEYNCMTAKIIQTIKLMSEIKVVRRLAKYNEVTDFSAFLSKSREKIPESQIDLIAIGASTGGPPVIHTILKNLPKDFPYPILIVQHITAGFLDGMVQWLSKEILLQIKIAAHGDPIRGGQIYFAPDDIQMGISDRGIIILKDAPVENGLRPSVSYLFRSAVHEYGSGVIGILLTGMGKDGSLELKKMRDQGAITIAQNQESSVVHGMPGEAIKLGGADHILNPSKIADFLKSLTDKNQKSKRFELCH